MTNCFVSEQNKTKQKKNHHFQMTYLTDKQNLNLTSLSIHLAINSIENYWFYFKCECEIYMC